MACDDAPLGSAVSSRIRVIQPISPVADLRPLLETTMNDDFRLDEAAARAESPVLLPKALKVPVNIWVGSDERPAFLDQARWLADAWAGTTHTVVEGRHHFNVIDALKDETSDMVRSLTT